MSDNLFYKLPMPEGIDVAVEGLAKEVIRRMISEEEEIFISARNYFESLLSKRKIYGDKSRKRSRPLAEVQRRNDNKDKNRAFGKAQKPSTSDKQFGQRTVTGNSSIQNVKQEKEKLLGHGSYKKTFKGKSFGLGATAVGTAVTEGIYEKDQSSSPNEKENEISFDSSPKQEHPTDAEEHLEMSPNVEASDENSLVSQELQDSMNENHVIVNDVVEGKYETELHATSLPIIDDKDNKTGKDDSGETLPIMENETINDISNEGLIDPSCSVDLMENESEAQQEDVKPYETKENFQSMSSNHVEISSDISTDAGQGDRDNVNETAAILADSDDDVVFSGIQEESLSSSDNHLNEPVSQIAEQPNIMCDEDSSKDESLPISDNYISNSESTKEDLEPDAGYVVNFPNLNSTNFSEKSPDVINEREVPETPSNYINMIDDYEPTEDLNAAVQETSSNMKNSTDEISGGTTDEYLRETLDVQLPEEINGAENRHDVAACAIDSNNEDIRIEVDIEQVTGALLEPTIEAYEVSEKADRDETEGGHVFSEENARMNESPREEALIIPSDLERDSNEQKVAQIDDSVEEAMHDNGDFTEHAMERELYVVSNEKDLIIETNDEINDSIVRVDNIEQSSRESNENTKPFNDGLTQAVCEDHSELFNEEDESTKETVEDPSDDIIKNTEEIISTKTDKDDLQHIPNEKENLTVDFKTEEYNETVHFTDSINMSVKGLTKDLIDDKYIFERPEDDSVSHSSSNISETNSFSDRIENTEDNASETMKSASKNASGEDENGSEQILETVGNSEVVMAGVITNHDPEDHIDFYYHEKISDVGDMNDVNGLGANEDKNYDAASVASLHEKLPYQISKYIEESSTELTENVASNSDPGDVQSDTQYSLRSSPLSKAGDKSDDYSSSMDIHQEDESIISRSEVNSNEVIDANVNKLDSQTDYNSSKIDHESDQQEVRGDPISNSFNAKVEEFEMKQGSFVNSEEGKSLANDRELQNLSTENRPLRSVTKSDVSFEHNSFQKPTEELVEEKTLELSQSPVEDESSTSVQKRPISQSSVSSSDLTVNITESQINMKTNDETLNFTEVSNIGIRDLKQEAMDDKWTIDRTEDDLTSHANSIITESEVLEKIPEYKHIGNISPSNAKDNSNEIFLPRDTSSVNYQDITEKNPERDPSANENSSETASLSPQTSPKLRSEIATTRTSFELGEILEERRKNLENSSTYQENSIYDTADSNLGISGVEDIFEKSIYEPKSNDHGNINENSSFGPEPNAEVETPRDVEGTPSGLRKFFKELGSDIKNAFVGDQ